MEQVHQGGVAVEAVMRGHQCFFLHCEIEAAVKRQAEVREEQSAIPDENVARVHVKVLETLGVHPCCGVQKLLDDVGEDARPSALGTLLRSQSPRVPGTYSRKNTMLLEASFIASSLLST